MERRGMVTFGMSAAILGDELRCEGLSAVKEVGMECVELLTWKPPLDLDDETRVQEIGAHAARIGLRVHSAHAPFGPEYELCSEDEAVRRNGIEGAMRSAEVIRGMGGRVVVVHGSLGIEEGEDRKALLDRATTSVAEIVDYCRTIGVVVAVENLIRGLGGVPEEMAAMVSVLPEEHAGVCLDIGHAHLRANEEEMISACAGRIVTTHVADNLGETDDHLLPFEGGVEWPKVLGDLKRTGYDGVLLMEISSRADRDETLRRMPDVMDRLGTLWG